ncbi:unnamed protein product [Amoebophrya sp. A120]|nr:unnamed protein product [Amoebophrya sp. A120]|eukprot:GSA120T00022907001.1
MSSPSPMRGSNTSIMRGMSATSLRTTSSSAGLNSNEAYREVGRQAFEDAKYQMTQEQKMNLLRKTKRLDQDKMLAKLDYYCGWLICLNMIVLGVEIDTADVFDPGLQNPFWWAESVILICFIFELAYRLRFERMPKVRTKWLAMKRNGTTGRGMDDTIDIVEIGNSVTKAGSGSGGGNPRPYNDGNKSVSPETSSTALGDYSPAREYGSVRIEIVKVEIISHAQIARHEVSLLQGWQVRPTGSPFRVCDRAAKVA